MIRTLLHIPRYPPISMFQRHFRYDLLGLVLCVALLALAMTFLHALDSGLSGSDEGSHFLNGYLVWSYLAEGMGQSPLEFAKEFYVHYPKISIGHWPPLYYAFLGCLFFVLPHSPFPFMVVNLLIGVLPALIVGRFARVALGSRWAIVASVICVMTPICLGNTMRLMLDQALASLCLVAAMVWSRYANEPNLKAGLLYALIAASAIMVKGNGWMLGLFPLVHILLESRWILLTNWRTYASGLLCLLLVGGWTVATYKISSDGFNYDWGFEYFFRALPNFTSGLYDSFGPIGIAVVVIGIIVTLVCDLDVITKNLGRTCLALAVSTVLFHSIVPVDLDIRYMSSAVPPLTILAVIGLRYVVRVVTGLESPPLIVFAALAAVLCVPGLQFLQTRGARFDLRMDSVAEKIAELGQVVVVVDGTPGVEGALTAEIALRDSERRKYVVRSSQLLAKSSFMGNQYALRVESPQAVLRALESVSGNAVVVVSGRAMEPRFPHSDLLRAALLLPESPYRLEQSYEHIRHQGKTELFVRTMPMAFNRSGVVAINYPAKALR